MSGFSVWVRKEALEIACTWRRHVLPLLVLIMAVLSPALARITPKLLRSFASSEPGVVIRLPDPTATDAIRQWAQSLSQIVIFAVVILAAGLVSNDLKEGTAQLALVKPLSRRAFLLAKVVVQTGFLAAVTVIGAFLCAAVTRALFASLPTAELARVTLAWLAFASVMICLVTLCSIVMKSQAAAAGAGIGLYFLFSLGGLWEPLTHYSPIGLLAGLPELAAGESFPLTLPLATGALTCAVALMVAIWRFQRQTLR